jgi:hypothetical protein
MPMTAPMTASGDPVRGAGAWLEIVRAGRRSLHELGREPLAVGAPGADVVLAGSTGTLRITGSPARVVHDGRGTPPSLGGRALGDAALRAGDRLEWGDATLEFVSGDVTRPAGLLEEIPLAETSAASSPRATRLVAAGVAVELGLADPAVVRRWQEAVRGGEYDADRAADELLASGRALEPSVLDDRCRRLLRDFLMTQALRGVRGTARRARGAARTGVAIIVSQTVAILVYTFLLVLCAVLVRYKWNVGFDGWIDAVLGRG